MKRFILSVLALFFGLFLVGVSVVAAVEQKEEATESGEMMVMDYYLPYPGILPDHPMYWLKMIRDRVLLWLTRDPVKKSERLLLYADKRIGAAQALAEGNQLELAVSTATKAEKYLAQVIDKVADQEGELKGKVKQAGLKHMEILKTLEERLEEESKGVLLQVTASTRESLSKLGVDGVSEEEEATGSGDMPDEAEFVPEELPAEMVSPSL